MVANFGTAYTLGEALGKNFDYLRNHTWEVQLSNLDSSLLAKSVVIPRTTVDVGELAHANEVVRYARNPKPSELVVEFYDAINPGIVDQLDTWFNQIYNPDSGQMGLASDYKRQGKVLLYDPTFTLIRTWTFKGAFPTSAPVPASALDYSSQDPVVIQVTFAIDRISKTGAATNTSGQSAIG